MNKYAFSTFIVSILLSFCLGQLIIQTVDQRLSDISIKVPPAKVVFKSPFGPEQMGGSVAPECPMPPARGRYDRDKYRSEAKKVEKVHSKVPHRSASSFKSQPAEIPYYRDPKDLTPAQQLKFRSKANLRKMTLTDYKNWLLLFREDPENLSAQNRRMLTRLIKGQEINAEDIPQSNYPQPHNARERYHLLVDGDYPQPDSTSTTVRGFPGFRTPQNLKHLSGINPDEYRKSSGAVLKKLQPAYSVKQKKISSSQTT